ncbi:30S ribosomal protein S2 [Candidatus Peregrinibacteria bacterium]|nr:30S ribosomal protein S2 [Candidatus Peregrinibacteria bacterium]
MSKNIVKEMMDAAMHFGHQTQRWNPKMKPYLYGSKNGIHIFDLEKTAALLDKAMEFLKQTSASGRTIMLASTKPQAARLIMEASKEAHLPYVVNKWMPGLFTNFTTIKKRIKYFNDLYEQEKSGELEKYTKKEQARFKKELIKLQDAFGGVRELDKLPAVVFVADVVRDRIIVKEANKMKIMVVAITDSNSDPDGVDFPIPANDDAISSLTFVVNKLRNSLSEAKGKK